MPKLLNLIAFQMLWLLLVFSAFYDFERLAVVLLGVWLCVHVYFSKHRWADVRLLLLALALGPLCDTLLLHLELVEYRGRVLVAGFPPLWIYAQWANFSQLFNYSFGFLRGRPLFCVFMALVSAPLAYTGGARLGAAVLVEPHWIPLIFVALSWAMVLPLLIRCSVKPQD